LSAGYFGKKHYQRDMLLIHKPLKHVVKIHVFLFFSFDGCGVYALAKWTTMAQGSGVVIAKKTDVVTCQCLGAKCKQVLA